MVMINSMLAANATRQYKIAENKKQKSVEKLSSGFQINRSADDAAGLSISEKMRSQIRGLNRGTKNIQEGMSLLQVADGAAQEVNDILNRLEELAVYAANGTLTDSDRRSIDEEGQALLAELNRIDATTTFNEKRVFFDGEVVSESATPTANSKFFQVLDGHVSTDGFMNETIDKAALQALNHTAANSGAADFYVCATMDFSELINNGKAEELVDCQFYANCCTDCCATVVQFTDTDQIGAGTDKPADNVKYVLNIGLKKNENEYYTDATEFTNAVVDTLKNSGQLHHVEFASNGGKLIVYDIDAKTWSDSDKKAAYFCDTSNFYDPGTMVHQPFWIQMGAQAEVGMSVETGRVDGKSLAIDPFSLKTESGANEAMNKVQNAVHSVGRLRAKMGAQYNRLEHGMYTNQNTAENTQAAESRLRDADLAKELVAYHAARITEEASQAMISQGNSSAQMVLNLLKS